MEKAEEIVKLITCLLLVFFGCYTLVSRTNTPPMVPLVSEVVSDPVAKFLAALSKVESNDNDQAIGDNGAALGRYQIHRAYWKDSRVLGSYEQVTDPEYAKAVVLAYFKRYASKALENQDWETLARIHNGGPGIMRRKGTKAWDNTTAYWNKVKAAMG